MPFTYEDTLQGETRNALTIPSTTGDVLRETFAQSYEENPIMALRRFSALAEDQVTGPQVTAEAARARLKDAGMENDIAITPGGITEAALSTLMERKRIEKRRQEILSRAQGGLTQGAERLGLSFLTTLADPVSAGLNFVPVVGQVRYARWLNMARTLGGRLAVRAAVGAAEGTVGAALAEIPIYAMRTQEQADYDMADSLLNVAFGGVIGAGLHTTVGSAAELISRRRPFRVPPQDAPRTEPTVAPESGDRAPQPIPAVIQNADSRALENDLNRMLDTQDRALRAVTEGKDAQAAEIRNDFSQLHEQLKSAREALDEASATLSEPRDVQIAREANRLAEADDKNRYARRRAREAGESADVVFPEWQKLAEQTIDGERERAAKQAELAREVIHAREEDIGRVNRIRSAETDLSQLNFLRAGAKSLPDLAAALPEEARQRMESRIAALGESGRAHVVGATDVSRAIDVMSPEMQQAALRTAVAQAVADQPINVFPSGMVSTEPELRQAVQYAEDVLAHEAYPTPEAILKSAEDEADLAVADATSIGERLGVDVKSDPDFTAVMEGAAKAERWARVAELATVCLVRGG
jgi:hypothetical protein